MAIILSIEIQYPNTVRRRIWSWN